MDRFDELLEAYLDGSLAEDAAADLATLVDADEKTRAAFLQAYAQHRALGAELGAFDTDAFAARVTQEISSDTASFVGAVVDDVKRVSVRLDHGRRFRRTFLYALAPALAVAAILVLALVPAPDERAPSPPPEVARVEPSIGPFDVTVARLDGAAWVAAGRGRRYLSDADVLEPDVTVWTDAKTTLRLAYADGTTVEATGDTEIELQRDEGKRVWLQHGYARLDVTPQRSPLVVETPHSKIEVLGTAFGVASGETQTVLEVDEGRVKTTDPDTGESVTVAADHYVVVGGGVLLEACRRDEPMRQQIMAMVLTGVAITVPLGQLGAANASERDLIPSGDFQTLDDNGVVPGWRLPRGVAAKLIKGGVNSYLRVTATNPRQHTLANYHIAIEKDWAVIKFTARMRIHDVSPGSDSWQTARVALAVKNAAGKVVKGGYAAVVQEREKTDGWVKRELEYKIPEGAKTIQIDVGFFFSTGEADFDDIRAEVVLKHGVAMDAKEPAGEITWGREPLEKITRTREVICLNGYWKFMPATKDTVAKPAPTGWGYLRVPGSWRRSGWPPVSKAGVVTGAGGAWVDGTDDLERAWYERPIAVPPHWAGRRVLLDLKRVSTDAAVYVDGKACGRVNWPGGELDITPHVTPGKSSTLRILVVAVGSEKEALHYMDADVVVRTKARINARGIIGDVLLSSRPRAATISDAFVRTSTRRKRVTIDVQLAGVRRAGEVELVARMEDERGRTERTFRETVHVRAADAQTVTVSWPWHNPRLWDVGKPNLYTLRLAARGAGLDDEYAQLFGFREFWIDGTKFLLNGTEVRLRPVYGHTDGHGLAEEIDNLLDAYVKIGFNFREFWPNDRSARGTLDYQALYAERASRKGFMIACIGPSMKSSVNAGVQKPEVVAEFERRMVSEMKPLRNFPSIVMWTSSGNFFAYQEDQDPRLVGTLEEAERRYTGRSRDRLDAGRKLIAITKAYDPTRPLFTHHGGVCGDVHTVNMYLDLIPLQEREEWLSHYHDHGDIPFMPVEFGTPLHVTFHRGRNGFGGAVVSEPLPSEFCAKILGPAAYEMELPSFRKDMKKRYRGGQNFGNWHGHDFHYADDVQKVMALWIRNTCRSWRTWGITGGMIPWANGHGWKAAPTASGTTKLPPFDPGRRGVYMKEVENRHLYKHAPPGNVATPGGEAMIASKQPTLAYIAGRDGDDDDDLKGFADKTHHYRAGDEIRKQLVLVNDTRSPQAYSLQWRVIVDGIEAGGGVHDGMLDAAETKLVPISARAPRSVRGSKVDGRVTLAARIDGVSHQDTFPFRVFLRAPRARGTVLVHDPMNKTTALLERLGYRTRPYRPGDRGEMLVVGWNAIQEDGRLPASLREFVESGGRAVVMPQEPDTVRERLGFRVAWHQSRRVFRVETGHPVVAGLDEDDLMYWTGHSTMLEPRPDYLKMKTYRKNRSGHQPYEGWRWGNRHTVSSAAIEKPHHTGWRPILQCEFDCAYTPLMELDMGRGRLIWCALDLEDHAALDPAAERLALQLFEYARTAALAPARRATYYAGGPAGAKLLDSMGLAYERARGVPQGDALLIVGPDSDVDATAASAFARRGGRILVMAQKASAPLGVTLKHVKEFGGSLSVPSWPEARGLGASDVRWRTEAPADLIAGGCEIGARGQLGRKRIGSGVVIYAQLDPDALNADEKQYFRYTRWRQTRAIAQLLANLGATFTMDYRIFQRTEDIGQISLARAWKAKMSFRYDQPAKFDDRVRESGMSDKAKAWVKTRADDSTWRLVPVPSNWEDYGGEWKNADGEAVFRTHFTVPEKWRGKDLVVSLGALHAFDETFLNGEMIGRTNTETKKWWEHKRLYTIRASQLKPGKNVLAVRIYNDWANGGFVGVDEELFIRPKGEKVLTPYHADYRADFDLGDDPFRYYRW